MKLIQKLIFTVQLIVFLVIQLAKTIKHLAEASRYNTKEILVNQFIEEAILLNIVILLILSYYIIILSLNTYKQVNRINDVRFKRLENTKAIDLRKNKEDYTSRTSRTSTPKEDNIFGGLEEYFKDLTTKFL